MHDKLAYYDGRSQFCRQSARCVAGFTDECKTAPWFSDITPWDLAGAREHDTYVICQDIIGRGRFCHEQDHTRGEQSWFPICEQVLLSASST